MKKFIGEVCWSEPDELVVRKKRTWVHVYYENDDAPIFNKGQTVLVESKYHFPPTYSTWTNEHGNLVTDRVRGKYYMYSDGINISDMSKRSDRR